MKLVFMGSGAFAVPSLERLLASSTYRVTALFTQPDKPAGRGHRQRPPKTKEVALAHGIDVHQPAKVRSTESIALIEELAPDCIVVIAYGQIIPKAILDIPKHGIINVHGSLLPRYRGAAPIQWAIAEGETETGVTTMLIDEGLDTGAILLVDSLAIGPKDTTASLSPKLSLMGAALIERTLDAWAEGGLTPIPQDEAQATKAPRIKKEDARIDWRQTATQIACRIRAFDPWPVAFTELRDAVLRIWKAAPSTATSSAPPGDIVSIHTNGIDVACGEGTVILVQEVQLSGKSRMAAADFARGKRLGKTSHFGSHSGLPSRPQRGEAR
ncbi:MAG: methionyl-tRNA formyltransferase [Acidobacteria bacterium]|nr:MAG: methionyl-tRNA formyltransferase [Acidobacteriota bacterium]